MNRKRTDREGYRNGRNLLASQPCKPDDGIGPYTREQLVAMDQHFAERLQHAISRGLERAAVYTWTCSKRSTR